MDDRRDTEEQTLADRVYFSLIGCQLFFHTTTRNVIILHTGRYGQALEYWNAVSVWYKYNLEITNLSLLLNQHNAMLRFFLLKKFNDKNLTRKVLSLNNAGLI